MQIPTAIYSMRAKLAYARGDFEATARETDREAEAEPAMRMFDGTWHIMVGLELRETHGLGLVMSDSQGGRLHAAVATIAAAGQQVLGGDRSQLVAMDEGIDRLEAVGFHLSSALLRRARARLHPDDPGAPAAAERAALFFRGVGALKMLRGLEPLLDDDAVAGEGATVGEAAPAGRSLPAPG